MNDCNVNKIMSTDTQSENKQYDYFLQNVFISNQNHISWFPVIAEPSCGMVVSIYKVVCVIDTHAVGLFTNNCDKPLRENHVGKKPLQTG